VVDKYLTSGQSILTTSSIAGADFSQGKVNVTPASGEQCRRLSSESWDLIQYTYVQKLTTIASAVPEISLVLKFKTGHVTLTTPLLRVICHPYAET